MARGARTHRRFSLGLRARLLFISIALVAVGLLLAQWFISAALDRSLRAHAQEQRLTESSLIAAAVRAVGAWDTAAADPLVREFASRLHDRVTLVAPDGRVVADSAIPAWRLPSVTNHGARPEVVEAIRTGRGVAQRQSVTVHRDLTYAATRIDGPGGEWVLRVAVSSALEEVTRAALWRLLGVGGALGLLVAAGMSWLAVALAARPLRRLTETAHAMVHDLSVRSRIDLDDDVGALAGALDELADNLASTLGKLERERDRLGAILESMAEGVLVTDAKGQVVLANRALREMFLLGGDVEGREPIEVVRNADLHELFAEAARSSGPTSRELSIEGLRPRRVMARVAPVEQAGAGAVAVLSDVTELRRLETVRRDFVANVSHELRTPVAAIRGAAETLLLGGAQHAETAFEFATMIDRHAERLHRLVEDLLELSRIEARELRIDPGPLELRSEAERARELLSLAAQARRTEVRVEVGALTVLADQAALEHVLTNLLENAIKYSPEGSVVTVRAERRGETVRTLVEDDGPGIEARHLPRLFERFYRVDAGRSRQVGGTGLGLAIVKHLAEAMGGAVGVESTVGRGSRFWIDLPVAPAQIS
ncbi:MAG: PAS domain-containing protein [Deltaproteobacteria bacterium]|nr:PAS domain-containing protein [Deltaproteobacteria bacterium]